MKIANYTKYLSKFDFENVAAFQKCRLLSKNLHFIPSIYIYEKQQPHKNSLVYGSSEL